MKKKKEKKKIKTEVVKIDKKGKIIYHYVDKENNVDVKSKEVYKTKDKFITYPFYVDKTTGEAKQKYKKVRSISFEGMKNKLPSGFITSALRGYGVTRDLKPLVRFIDNELVVSEIAISKLGQSELKKGKIIINDRDLDKIRKFLHSSFRSCNEKNKALVENYFAKMFPSKFKARRERYQRGTISRLVEEFDFVEKNLSVDDKNVLLSLFEKTSLERNDLFKKNELIVTKEKIERRFIEDIIKEFKRLLSLKKINEERWQRFFKENAWIFSQLFAYPAVLFEDKAFVGGKNIENIDGKVVDFLYANKLTKNSALIEIKKHTTKLLSKTPYRSSGVFNMDKELSGAISQVLDQKETYCKKFDSIRDGRDVNAFNPKCFVLIGRIKDLEKKQLQTFELIRSSLKDVEIITFDELFDRINSILSIFKGGKVKGKK